MKRIAVTAPVSRLLCLCLLPLAEACGMEDDVVEIFTSHEWKLSYIAAEGSNDLFDFWSGNEKAREQSLNYSRRRNTYRLEFSGVNSGSGVNGTFTGYVVSGNISGPWQANPEGRTLTLTVTQAPNETDVYARAFVDGLRHAFRYEGDTSNLFIYYRDGQTVKRLGFVAAP